VDKETFHLIKDKLLTLPDLNTAVIKKMTEKQLLSYVQVLSVTADTFPVQKEELEYALQEMDHMQVVQWLKILSSSLSQIHADNLVNDCEKQIGLCEDIESIRHDRLKAFIEYFMSTLGLLFSDIHHALEDLHLDSPVHKHDEAQPERIKEKLRTITELNFEKIEQMTESELYKYLETLDAFQNEYSSQENGLRGSIKIKHYAFVMQWLNAIEESLAKIHADALLENCRSQISLNKDFNSIRPEKLEAFVNYFLTTMSMLSADIKMLNLPAGKPEDEQGGADGSDRANIADFEVILPAGPDSNRSILTLYKMKIFSHSLKMALADSGHELIGITTGEDALRYMIAKKPDLFILDEDFSGIGAYEIAKVIRKIGQKAPIIYTTSTITKETMVKFMEAGVADFIMKPITASEVQGKVSKHLI